MDIKITYNWLKEYLDTKATPQKIAECLSLCGPSVERINKVGNDYVYDIEVTTNRVDTVSVIGIAREAATILPQFGIKAKFIDPLVKLPNIKAKNKLFSVISDKSLNKRVMAVAIQIDPTIKTPQYIKERLEGANMRSLNLAVDITNYVMLEIGHPTHVFDLDKIASKKLIFRLSKKGEKITTLDSKTYTLSGGDIVIDDGAGKIIDLPGIMGTKNSVVDGNTKQILFFIDNNEENLMRRTSLELGIRTMAVQINEKGPDTELAMVAMVKGISLFTKLAKGKILSQVIDIYDQKPKIQSIKVSLEQINSTLGVTLTATKISEILKSLGFLVKIDKDEIIGTPPTFRSNDISIPEDIVEEIARIYGYFNIASKLPSGDIPVLKADPMFSFETKVRNILEGFGGVETLTISLVSKEIGGNKAIAIKNPLGADTGYLQTSLIPSMKQAAKQNSGVTEMFHMYQIANVYKFTQALPEEKLMLGGAISNCDWREAKGQIEGLFEKLNIENDLFQLGKFEQVSKNLFVYEFAMVDLLEAHKPYKKFNPLPKYPAQVEDFTIKISPNQKVGEIMKQMKKTSKLITKVDLVDIYEQSYTFRIWYQDPNKTLTDKDVEEERKKIEKLF